MVALDDEEQADDSPVLNLMLQGAENIYGITSFYPAAAGTKRDSKEVSTSIFKNRLIYMGMV